MQKDETLKRFREIIQKKAFQRASEEVQIVVDAIKKSGLLDIEVNFKVVGEGYQESLRESLWNKGSLGMKNPNPLNYLLKAKYEKYIIEETDLFVKKIEQLTDQASELLNIAENFEQ